MWIKISSLIRWLIVKFVIVHEILNKNPQYQLKSVKILLKWPIFTSPKFSEKNHYGVTDFHFQPRSMKWKSEGNTYEAKLEIRRFICYPIKLQLVVVGLHRKITVRFTSEILLTSANDNSGEVDPFLHNRWMEKTCESFRKTWILCSES